MKYRPLGRTAIETSVLGFGCGGVGGLFVQGSYEEQREAVEVALAAGVNYFDTAELYGEGRSEQNLGRVLNDLGSTAYVGTKIRIQPDELGDAAKVARQRLEEGLARLGRDRVDLCMLHSRVAPKGGVGHTYSAAEVTGPIAEAMHGLVNAGLTGAIGFTGLGETPELRAVMRSGHYDTMQCYYNVLNQSAGVPGSPDGLAQDFDGILEDAAAHELAAVGIRVFAGGALTGASERHRYSPSPGPAMAEGEEYEADLARAGEIAERLGEYGVADLPELAFRFALSEPRLSTVLIGFSDLAQVQAAVRAEAAGPLAPDALLALQARPAPA